MKTNQIRWGALTLTTIALLLLAGTAGATPAIAPQFYGGVTINGGPATDGTMIVAKIDGTDRGSITTLNGWYGGAGSFDPKLLVSADTEELGQTITFFVRVNSVDYQTGQTAVFAQEGSLEQLELTATVPVQPHLVPAIASLSPATATAGGPAFVLTVYGFNFYPVSVVRWNGADRTTTFVGTNQLSAQISASDIVNQGTAAITVFTSPPGGGTSNSVTFTIGQQQNPIPGIGGISPVNITAGSSGFTLTVTGTGFIASSIIRWNGADRGTTYVSATQLTASISASDVANSGDITVAVFNPAPGGGTSNGATFTINARPQPLAIIPPGGEVFIGEIGLDVTQAVPDTNQVVWYGPNDEPYTIVLTDKTNFYVANTTFLAKQGNWYRWYGSAPRGPVAFVVKEPQIALLIWDEQGRPIVRMGNETNPIRFAGTPLNFRIETNLYTIAMRPGFNAATDGFINISVQNPQGVLYDKLVSIAGAERSILSLPVNINPYFWASSRPEFWNTGAQRTDGTLVYPAGVYTVNAKSTANQMQINYPGKTISSDVYVDIQSEKVSVSTNVPSVSRSETSFTATVKGRPNAVYYLWVKECPLKSTGYPCKQPPMIRNTAQAGVELDPVNGPYTIGGRVVSPECCYPGTRINDTVPKYPVNGVRYYSRITTDQNGERNVEFEVSPDTQPMTYTIHAEGDGLDGTVRWADTQFTVNLGQVTIEIQPEAFLGERIPIKGTNTDTNQVYLFLTGPCLPICGVNLRNLSPVQNGVPGTFVEVKLPFHETTWALDQDPLVNPSEAVWDTSKVALDAGEFTVWAVSKPHDGCTLTESCPGCICAAYAVANITLKKPTLEASMTPEFVREICRLTPCTGSGCDIKTYCCGDPCGPCIALNGTATGLVPPPDQPGGKKYIGLWMFGETSKIGDVHFIHDYIEVDCNDAFSVDLGAIISKYTDLSRLEPGTYDVLLTHPMYNHMFDTVIETEVPVEERPNEPNKMYVISLCPIQWSKEFVIQGPGAKWETEGRDALIKSLDNECVDDIYVQLKLHVRDADAPSADFVADKTAGNAPLEVQFTDLSTGEPVGWVWDFGDGETSIDKSPPPHLYANEGYYTVKLTVINAKGKSDTETKTDYIEVTRGPLDADFSGDPNQGAQPLSVQFTDLSTGNPKAWLWNFGDGGTSNAKDPSYTYIKAGVYTVSLVVWNDMGEVSTETKQSYIVVGPGTSLVADFSGDPLKGSPPLIVQFTDLSTGGPIMWSWDFGDGGTSMEADPVHTYMNSGSYTVKLIASNIGASNTKVKERYITVSATSITLKTGWNFVSTPKKLLAGYDTGDIFSEVDRAGHSIWLYDGYQKLWVRMDSTTPVRPLDGIWIFARAPVNVPLVYDTNPIQLPPTKMLAQGWNTVGFTGLTAATARDTLLSVVNNWTQVMGFDADAQQYDVSIINKGSGEHSDTRLMFPTKGYWIYMTSPGEVTAIGV